MNQKKYIKVFENIYKNEKKKKKKKKKNHKIW